MVQSVSYPGCKSAFEDTIHALWGCLALMPVWEANGLRKNLLNYKFSKFADLLELVFTNHGGFDMDLLANLGERKCRPDAGEIFCLPRYPSQGLMAPP